MYLNKYNFYKRGNPMRAKFVSDNLNVLVGGVLLLVLAVTAAF